MDLDEALLRLWDVGLSYIADVDTRIRPADLNRARRAIGIPTRRELTSPSYWQTVLRLDDAQFSELLASLEIAPRACAIRLPKGSVAKLKAELRRRQLPSTLEPEKPTPAANVSEPFEFAQVGRATTARCLTTSQILGIHQELARDFADADDPIEPAGLRSQALLDSAVSRPQTSLGDDVKYQTVEMAGAALLHALVHNHPFHNGNKRTALVALLVMLDENGMMLTSNEDDLFRFVLHVAQHRVAKPANDNMSDREVVAIARWIWQNSRRSEKGERAIQFRKLRQILGDFGCELEFPAGVGNRVNISRRITRSGNILSLLIGVRSRVLKTQVAYRNEGSDVQQDAVAKVRADLELDEAHGVDSAAFYDAASLSASDFVVLYRKTLRRLARV